MADPVIVTDGLRKEYRTRRGRRVALDGVELTVERGEVHGFLGPNGSGKTTTIRCLLGLVRPTGGSIQMLGCQIPSGLPEVISRIGSVVETPALFPTMSGRENLILLAALDDIPVSRVDQLLDEVGLGDRSRDQVKRYSLGMRQRLGIAAALLKDPELVILDEPANGLDPAGIRDVRQLLRQLADEGRTVLVSSHILSEIEQTCDSVTILSHGKTVISGRVGEVMTTASGSRFVVRSTDQVRAAEVLTAGGMDPVQRNGDLLVSGVGDPARITRSLGAVDVWVTHLEPEVRSLEDLFLELTAEMEVVL